MIFNPTDQEMKRKITIPLYFAGLKNMARIREKEGALNSYSLNRNHEAEVTISLPAKGYSWWVVE